MKMIKRIIPVFLVAFCFSCQQDILDIEPQDRIAESAVWTDAKLIESYHAELYNAVPHGFFIHMLSKYTDEAYNSTPCCGANIFAQNTFNPDNIASAGGGNPGDFWAAGNGYLYYWDYAYTYIRKINVFLEKMDEVDVNIEKDRLIGEAKFLRAMVYFRLLKTFGGVPIVTEVYELGDDVQFSRNTIDEVVAFIEQDIADAMAGVPESYASDNSNFGRATDHAAQALLSRMYLYLASPLFNPSNDMQKWQDAADAAEALLTEGYDLHPDYQAYFELQQGAANDETIYSRGFTTANGHQAPMHSFNRRFEGYGGWWGSNGPTLNLVEDYDMINGEPALLPDGSVNPASGYDPQDPFTDRDPRFNATIIHDESEFRGVTFETWISEDQTQWGYDSYRNTGDNPRTNFVLKKFMPSSGPFNWSTQFTMQWPIFRIAEIYLNYAEAQFELGDEDLARQYVNMVRARASVNLPPIPNTVTGEDLRRRIYNERRIEFAFEGHRFWDVRRWMIADVTENGPIRTLDVFLDLDTDVKRYEEVTLLDKSGTWEDQMYFLPIAEDEVRRNPGIQTPGW